MTPSDGIVAELALLGPFFAIDVHDPAQRPSAPWAPMSELAAGGPVLSARIAMVRAELAASARRPIAEVEVRVAASITHLGLVARLLAPALAIAALGGQACTPSLDELWWQDQLGGAVPLSMPPWPARSVDVVELARRLRVDLINGVVAQLARSLLEHVGLSNKVLSGNIASALNGAAQQLVRLRPDQAAVTVAIADAILADPELNPIGAAAGADFRRDSCCLIYRVAGDRRAVCADCVLHSAGR